MRSANDFEKCLSALYTGMINKRARLDTALAAVNEVELDTPEELELEAKYNALAADYRASARAYREGLALL